MFGRKVKIHRLHVKPFININVSYMNIDLTI